MKKTCNGCKASIINRFHTKCDLNFKVDTVYSKNCLFAIEGKPLEECPKPKTNREYCELLISKNEK